MPVTRRKLAACEPCRASKLACDHGRPVCSRCRDAARQNHCTYRDSPFKKTKRPTTSNNTMLSPGIMSTPNRSPSSFENSNQISDSVTQPVVTKPHKYPNPGYLGSFSYTTLFGNLPGISDAILGDTDNHTDSGSTIREANILRGASLVERIHETASIAACHELTTRWLARGSNLAVAAPILDYCLDSVRTLFPTQRDLPINGADISRNLFLHTSRPLKVNATTTIEEFSAQFKERQSRWETLGLFFTAASRAATEMWSSFDSEKERRDFQRLGMNLSDLCLDIALSLDCLNDLQLVLQYENWILHSFVDGDQSYHSWKRLGDVASSLFALGYHQQVDSPSIPPFLSDLRRATFAVTYSADKNVSIFLGRPPRVHRKYCKFVLPRSDGPFSPEATQNWDKETEFDYVTDIRWGALCAVLKEDILELFNIEGVDEHHPKIRDIITQAQAQWDAFPERFRLDGPLKYCVQQPVVRDFLVNAKLTHLHVLFLLRMAVTRSRPASDIQLVSISADILSLIVEAILQKDCLVNSGTSLVWKVAYYGLSAAGVICLWLLNHSSANYYQHVDVAKVVQNLSVLVAEMESGVLIETDDPNYKLLVDASKTIGSLLSRLIHGRLSEQNSGQVVSAKSPSELLNAPELQGWNAWDGHSLQDFESDFWLNLAEHPFLARPQDL